MLSSKIQTVREKFNTSEKGPWREKQDSAGKTEALEELRSLPTFTQSVIQN